MTWSIPIGSVGGTVIRIHVTFLLLLLWIAITYYVQGGTRAAIESVTFVVLLFACVVLHEFGHVLAARQYGVQTPDITLSPIGGVARLSRIPENPGQELVIALAGPVNVVIAACCISCWVRCRRWPAPTWRIPAPPCSNDWRRSMCSWCCST